MNAKFSLFLIFSILLITILACSQTPATQALPTPNTQATVDAAVAATATAQANLQATIDASVQATITARPMPTLTVDTASMTEEQLAAEVNTSMEEANQSLQTCSTTTSEAASDNVVTQEEVDTMETYVDETYYYLDEALALLEIYDEYYGELAEEAVNELVAMEDEIYELVAAVDELNQNLEEINAALQEGEALTEEMISQLQSTASIASAKANEIAGVAQAYLDALPAQLEQRASLMTTLQAADVPTDLQSTLTKGFEYLDSVKTALEDGKINRAELEQIASLGASFSAGAKQFGGPQIQALAEKVSGLNGITASLAAGRTPQARAELGNFEAGLGERPKVRKP